MQLVERHVIKPRHKYYRDCDKLSLLSKNIYNSANYIYRQNYFKGLNTNAQEVYHQLKTTEDYKALPAKVSQNTLRNELARKNIGVLVIGWNCGFKDQIFLGRVNNQKFVSIPHKRLIEQLEYKGLKAGLEVVLVNESYTSKCSALDNESIEKHSKYLGKRVKRGLFKTAKGIKINADINGSMNIGRIYQQVVGNAQAHPIEGVVVHPVRIYPYQAEAKSKCDICR